MRWELFLKPTKGLHDDFLLFLCIRVIHTDGNLVFIILLQLNPFSYIDMHSDDFFQF